jgi:hypothetical protein
VVRYVTRVEGDPPVDTEAWFEAERMIRSKPITVGDHPAWDRRPGVTILFDVTGTTSLPIVFRERRTQ